MHSGLLTSPSAARSLQQHGHGSTLGGMTLCFRHTGCRSNLHTVSLMPAVTDMRQYPEKFLSMIPMSGPHGSRRVLNSSNIHWTEL